MSLALVLVTHADGMPDDVSLQAATFARSASGEAPVALLIGADEAARTAAGTLGQYGVRAVHLAEHPALTSFAPDAWARILVDLAERLGAAMLVGPGSDAGNDVLARAAARIGQPFAAGCTTVAPGDPLAVTRIRWGGTVLEEALVRGSRPILSVAPHTVTVEAVGGSATLETFSPQLSDADLVVRVVERIGAATGGVSLADARVVVTGGRGVGSAEGFAPIEDLAALLGGAVGCSRAVTIAGWRAHTDQVGQTGTKIAPEIYICCGVSGATQHMAGCKGAKRILAINNDPESPIIASADFAIIGDLHEVVPAIAAEIRRVRGG